MSTEAFPYDVFLSHSAKDKAVVRPLAERLRQGKAERRRQKPEILHSAFFFYPLLCVFGSDWPQLACPAIAARRRRTRPAEASERRRKAGTRGRGNLPIREPFNSAYPHKLRTHKQERRFSTKLQPSAFRLQPFLGAPIKGSLAQFLYTNWRPADRDQEYADLREVCHPSLHGAGRNRIIANVS